MILSAPAVRPARAVPPAQIVPAAPRHPGSPDFLQAALHQGRTQGALLPEHHFQDSSPQARPLPCLSRFPRGFPRLRQASPDLRSCGRRFPALVLSLPCSSSIYFRYLTRLPCQAASCPKSQRVLPSACLWCRRRILSVKKGKIPSSFVKLVPCPWLNTAIFP